MRRWTGAAEELASSARDAAPAAQTRTPGGSALMMVLVAGLFVGSALISLTLLWLAVRTMRWLLGDEAAHAQRRQVRPHAIPGLPLFCGQRRGASRERPRQTDLPAATSYRRGSG